jgi:ATP-dependent protease ClpP protease subunit
MKKLAELPAELDSSLLHDDNEPTMKTLKNDEANLVEKIVSTVPRNLLKPLVRADNSVDYLGTVNYATNERVLMRVRELTQRKPKETIFMTVTSPGGPTGTAMSFFDHMAFVLKPNLVTIGSGDVDSSGLIIFLSGDRRYVTKHTTLLLHCAGRIFNTDQRFTAPEIQAMSTEDMLKDEQYAELVAARSRGKLTKQKVKNLMSKNTILTPRELLKYGLADAVLE